MAFDFTVLLFPSSWVHEKERQNNKVDTTKKAENLFIFLPYYISKHCLLK